VSTAEIVVLVAVVVVALLVVAAAAALLTKRRHSSELRETFGSEYDRTVEGSDKRRDAERELEERKQRHAELELRPLSSATRQRYLTAWDGVQNRFVDSPVLALSEADALLTQLLAERGFPTDDLRTQVDMLSVEHRHVLDSFRAGHAIEQQNTTGNADTEQVRQGMLHFREVFEAMVSEGDEPYPSDAAAGDRQRESR
jgi:hypothetical protein